MMKINCKAVKEVMIVYTDGTAEVISKMPEQAEQSIIRDTDMNDDTADEETETEPVPKTMWDVVKEVTT